MFNRRLVSGLLLGVGGPVLLFAVSFPIFDRAREKARRSTCQSNLKQLGLGLAQYRQDAEGKLPLVALNAAPPARLVKDRQWPKNWPAYGWADSLYPYLKNVDLLPCPDEANSPGFPANVSGYIDYWFNANLSASRAKSPTLIMLGDGEGRSTARYSLRGFPANWRDSPREKVRSGTQPPWFERHLGGANYAFADGHVKWLRPEDAAPIQHWKPNR
jgi:prepilin-type processing-associated H-X9-DG protein